MTHLSSKVVSVAAAALVAIVFVACDAAPTAAQCSSCATPTVAYYQPAVAYPAYATYYRPGLFDRWRMRRWGVVAPVATAPTYATSYAPYTAAYTPYAA